MSTQPTLEEWLARGDDAGRKARKLPRHRSKSKARGDRLYLCHKKQHLEEHPQCSVPGCTRSLRNGDLIDLHHKAGRNACLLWLKRFFATLCREHHNRVKDDPKWAESLDLIVRISSEELRELNRQELMAGRP